MNIYLVIVTVLLILAVSDLIVGISNDAANFINSAVGSRVASLRVILSVAGLGVLVGATFSSGMMEIARSGIFHPAKFSFSEVMIIFLAVMITDVILLDTFNTFGFPTSTTVSVIFELLGASVAISLIKISALSGSLADLGNYINSAKALAIISGILISVALAFTFGTIVMFITRLIFTFNYEKYMKYFGALWGALAITAIVYFMLVKGAKGASFMTTASIEWIHSHTVQILAVSFISFSVLLHLLIVVFKVNILRIIILVGTFSLAMAFAGNDMVNFIGVPLAGLESFKDFSASLSQDPSGYMMESLSQPVRTPTLFLIIAGTIMVITLFTSKKARTVSQTEITLARQGEGYERFSSSFISRSLVRGSVNLTRTIRRILPKKLILFVENRFDYNTVKKKNRSQKEASSFDLLRASVNMFVASILIATGTSLKLPLSTTYVTFMVAMGTSLADRAWGRESAVYRITGVLSVISGWFFTAVAAFTASLLIALFLHWGGITAIILALAAAAYFLIRTNLLHKKIFAQVHKKDDFEEQAEIKGESIIRKCSSTISEITEHVAKLYFSSILNLAREDRKKMKKTLKSIQELNHQVKSLKNNAYQVLRKLEENSLEAGQYYVQTLDYLREIAHCLTYISQPIYEHIDNNHPPLIKEQVKDLHLLNEEINSLLNDIVTTFRKQNFKDINKLILHQRAILDLIAKIKKRQLKLIKDEIIGTRNAMLYLNLLSESKNLVLYAINLLKSHRDFILAEEEQVLDLKVM